MKNIIRKTLLASVVTAAMGFCASASADELFPDFTVNASLGGVPKTFIADKILGGYVELINLTSASTFNVSLYWTASGFQKNDGENPVTGTGLLNNYGLYAFYNASGTYTPDGQKTVFNFTPGTGTLKVWLDPSLNTEYVANASNTAFEVDSNTLSDDIQLATGTALEGTGTLDPTLSTCGTGTNPSARGINCGSFGSTTSFVLTEQGKQFFTTPTAFYPLSFQSGQLNNFQLTGNQKTNGSLDVVFSEIPEPTSVALLGLGLIGLGLSHRRSKKA